ncbi:DUF2510 domain-containing protein [Granulicoccus phenolivorans]|uniref:DUF2510 domain-containing protein n=1 Tax=Granulicoccus phenolivorans TaxID=266854 RepID=UPI00040C528E|nr:DUF2510 domain-containing protein [Granulicoccus phenolivorans]
MQQAGWYPDPAGTPNSERFWDGTRWTTQVRRTSGGPIPSAGTAVPPAGGPMPPRTSGTGRTPLVVGAAAVVLIVAVVLGLILIPDRDSAIDPPISPPTSEPGTSGPASPTPGPARGDLDCWAGNQSATGAKETPYISTGLAYEAPGSWGFRFAKDQWAWLDDQAVWGSTRPATRGVALGGLNQQAGFGGPEQAGQQHLTCLMEAGVYAGEQTEIRIGETTEVEVNGMKAYQTEASVPSTQDPLQLQVLVFPTRTSGSVAVWMGFWTPGDAAAEAEVRTARDTIRAA